METLLEANPKSYGPIRNQQLEKFLYSHQWNLKSSWSDESSFHCCVAALFEQKLWC